MGLGELEIGGGGILSLSERDFDTMRMYYDITEAERQGCSGQEPKVWGVEEWHHMIEMLGTGLNLRGK